MSDDREQTVNAGWMAEYVLFSTPNRSNVIERRIWFRQNHSLTLHDWFCFFYFQHVGLFFKNIKMKAEHWIRERVGCPYLFLSEMVWAYNAFQCCTFCKFRFSRQEKNVYDLQMIFLEKNTQRVFLMIQSMVRGMLSEECRNYNV